MEWARVVAGVAITVFLLMLLVQVRQHRKIIDVMLTTQRDHLDAINTLIEFTKTTNERLARLERKAGYGGGEAVPEA